MTYIIFIVAVLFILAIIDLIVGVSNDAVNFLNSAIGSKAAPFRTIIIVAILGVFIGSFFSTGIMEIARKGIFHPQYFTFDKVMWIFLAVMLTDIILLDVFNSMGLPTSTTVSIVFELLGAAFVTGILFSFEKNERIGEAFKYINFESTISIISGIFLSILIAFTAGAVLQFVFRALFTFEYKKNLHRYGPVFSGLGITTIVYFLFLKGLKGSSLLNPETREAILGHTFWILGVAFVLLSLLFHFLHKFAKVNPLKIVVLTGTFALAMAFAGNDLVNFIGVPISGFLAFKDWVASGQAAGVHYQTFLAQEDVVVPNYMLLIAGMIMSLTIWLSTKARKVTETEVNLSRQQEGEERFKPNAVSRSIVKSSLLLGNIFSTFLPRTVSSRYNVSFEKNKIRQATNVQDTPAFDLVRASSNLIIASILIAWATSMKLPLSTTYVTFMVAMGSSLADKAWGRDSAVYRVAGVLSVIGGWFITAIIAFAVSGIFALIIFKTGTIGTILLIAVAFTYMILSQISFAKKEKKAKRSKGRLYYLEGADIDLYEKNKLALILVLNEVNKNYGQLLKSLLEADVAALKKINADVSEMVTYSDQLRRRSIKSIKELRTVDQKTAEVMLYGADLLQDMLQSMQNLSDDCYHYVINLHRLVHKDFAGVTDDLQHKMSVFFTRTIEGLKEPESRNMDVLRALRNDLRDYIHVHLDGQLRIIQRSKMSTKEALLQTNIFLQSRDIQAVLLRISKMYLKYEEKPLQSR